MFVQQVGREAAQTRGVVKLNAHVKIQRTDRRLIRHQNFFRLPKVFKAPSGLRFGRRRRNECVVIKIGPARPVVAVARDEHV